MTKSAILVLEDGTVFKGTAIGAQGAAVGEVVFNTSMTGYQEILTDPSYAEQIVTLTYPHIGNTGTNSEDEESNAIWAKGLVIRDLQLLASNFRNEEDLSSYLKRHNILGIADIDTRKLTRILREKGAQNGCILAGDNLDEAQALKQAQEFPGLKGMDLAKVVTCEEQHSWTMGSWQLGKGYEELADERFHVVAYDYGVKRNILRMLVDRGCRLTVVPAQTSAEHVLAMNPDGIFLSNGPGDPEPCTYAIDAIKSFLETDIPIFGICLGHQLLALAAAILLRQGLMTTGRELTPTKLVANMETLYQFETSLTRPVSYGPNRRLGTSGAYVVTLDLVNKTIIPVSNWLEVE